MMDDNIVGGINLNYDACTRCRNRDKYSGECTLRNPSFDADIDFECVYCDDFEAGDPPTEEEIEEQERRERFAENDQYQEKMFSEALTS